MQKKTINDLLLKYKDYNQTLTEYIDFLVLKQYATFISDYREKVSFLLCHFIGILPSEVSNAIIEFSNNSKYSLDFAINQMNAINCHHLLIKFKNSISKDTLLKLVDSLKKTKIKTISIYINCNTIDFNDTDIIESISKLNSLKDIILFKSLFNFLIKEDIRINF